MAHIREVTEEEIKVWNEWVSTRPEVVRNIANRFNPWTLYKLKDTGQRCTLYSISEEGTVTVVISGDYNLVDFERRVFGINPDDLEETELPREDEPLGSLMTPQEVEDNMDKLRVQIRPDLWIMGKNSKATRRTH